MFHLLTSIVFILLIFLVTYLVALKWPKISKIIFAALFVRFFVLILGFFFELPESFFDAKTFEFIAWNWSQNGFFGVFEYFPGAHPDFISWFYAIIYSLFGRNILLLKLISLLLGVTNTFLGWYIVKKVYGDRFAINAGWFMALFPTLILYSTLTLREVYICFFLLTAMIGILSWTRDKKFISIIITLVSFIGATFFHGALFLGAIVFLYFVIYDGIFSSVGLVNKNKLQKKHLSIFIVIIFIMTLYTTNNLRLPYLGYFDNFDISKVLIQLKNQGTYTIDGTLRYPEWFAINSIFEIVYKLPLRIMYFLFSPFITNVYEIKHLLGVIDSLFYIYLLNLIFRNRNRILKDPFLKIIFYMVLVYLILFSISVSNSGTAIRHRAKFVTIFIILGAQFLHKITFKKETILRKKNNK